MRLDISAWAIRNPIPPIVLFLVLTALGIVSFRNLPITLFPNIDIPIVTVQVTQSGAAPSELEKQVTKRIEDGVAGVAGVKHIISRITDGQSLAFFCLSLLLLALSGYLVTGEHGSGRPGPFLRRDD